jgi:lysophospholipase L1-like esterase
MIISQNSTLVMVGDSITDAGRDPSGNPTPSNLALGLGRGYVAIVDARLTAKFPEKAIRVINRGVSGNTCLDVAVRWEKDVIAAKPDWVSLMIGTNDVWRQFDQPLAREIHVSIAVYEQTLNRLVERTKPLVKGLVLMTPFMIEPNRDDAMRRMMDEYGAVVKQLAKKHATLFVDTQKAFASVLKHRHAMSIAWDRIHPDHLGHTLIANAFLTTVEADNG